MFQTNSDSNTLTNDWKALTVVLGSLLLLYYLVPLISLLGQPIDAIATGLLNPSVSSAALTSLATALTSTCISTVFGVPLAYWLSRTEFRGKTLATVLIAFPLVLPPIVSGMVLLSVFGPNTPIGSVAANAGLPLTRSFTGIVLAQIFVASPFIVITSKAAFEGVERQLEYASRTLGKDTLTTFRSISLPLAKPGIFAGITLAFARAIGEFGATMMIAYYPRTMPVQIWVAFNSHGLDEAFPVAIFLLVVSLISLTTITMLGRSPWR